MKRVKMSHFVLLLILSLSIVAEAGSWVDANGVTWSYRVQNGEAEINAATEPNSSCNWAAIPTTVEGVLTIPSKVDGYIVTGIGVFAIGECSLITGAIIPDTVKYLDDYAFVGCSSLKTIRLPDGVERIGSSAFSGCKSLKEIYLGKSVRTIGEAAFSRCAFTELEIPASVTIIGRIAFWAVDLQKLKFDGNKPEIEVDDYFGPFYMDSFEVYYPFDADGWFFNDSKWGKASKITYISYGGPSVSSLQSLQDRINHSADGAVIQLDGNGVYSDALFNLQVPMDKLVTLDLNGVELACNTITVSGSLILNDSSVRQTGRVICLQPIGGDGPIVFNGNKKWSVDSNDAIQNIIRLNKRNFGVAISLCDQLSGTDVCIPSGEKLPVDIGGKVFVFSASSNMSDVGGVTPAYATDMKVENGVVRIKVTVDKTESLQDPNWQPVPDVSATLEVPATTGQGYFRLQSKGGL